MTVDNLNCGPYQQTDGMENALVVRLEIQITHRECR